MKLTEVFDRVVFLFGAGSSKDAGCSLSKEMLTSLEMEIKNLEPGDDFGNYKIEFEEIYGFILASLSYQMTLKNPLAAKESYLNIEDFVMVLRQLIDKEFIIPYPLIGNWNQKIIKWEIKNSEIFSDFLKFITVKLISEWTTFDAKKARKILSPITNLLSTPEDICLHFFSLNYDLIFEETFNSANVKLLDDGFSVRDIDNDKTKYWAGEFNSELNRTKINLYKLHGSLNWLYNKTTEEIVIGDSLDINYDPLIIFGSYSKMLSFDPFLYFLSKFRDSLEKSTILVTIGYSFHDKYINNLIIQQLSQNTENDLPKKLIVVDPYLEMTEKDFSESLKSIQNSKSLNDVINFSNLSAERIKIVKKQAKNFYKEYFSNNAEKMIEELHAIDISSSPF